MKQENDSIFSRPFFLWGCALFCCALWGSALPTVKLGYAFLHLDPLDSPSMLLFAGIRFTMAGIVILTVGSISRKKLLLPTRESCRMIPMLSLFQTIFQYSFFYIGMAHTSGVNSSILDGTGAFFSLLIAGVFFRMEAITGRKLLGCILGFSGVLLVALTGGNIGRVSVQGEGFVLLSVIGYATSSVLMKRYSRSEDPLLLSSYQFILGGIVLSLLGLGFGGRLETFNLSGGLVLGWLIFVSAMAYSLWSTLLKYHPVSRVTVFSFAIPVFGVILSIALLGEKGLGGILLLALALVCAGIYICNSSGKNKSI